MRLNRFLGINERRLSAERKPDERAHLPFGSRGRRRQQPDRKNQARRPHYRTNRFKNNRANGDNVTSPFRGEYSFTRPSLFAIRMTVSPRAGNMIISDEDAFSAMPNCHTTFSPL